MPIYQYKCDKCNHKIERLESYVDSKKRKYCDEYENNSSRKCNGKMLRQVSNSNFSLKGECWAKDNYK